MPTPALSTEDAQEAFEAFQRHNSKKLAAESLGIHPNTFTSRLSRAYEYGLHLSEGAQGAVNGAGLSGVEAKAGWIVEVDPETGSRKSTYWRAPGLPTESLFEQISAAFENITPAPRVRAPRATDTELLTLYPLADVHMGLMAWGKETGEDYDTGIAAERVKEWMAHCINASMPSQTAIILCAGDLTHADDQTNQTPASKHQLDVDTRHFKTLEVTIAALAASIELALEKHRQVIVRIIPGNHDKTTYMAILFALAERYRDNPRVEVQKDPGEFFAFEFGKNMLASHHGDKGKAERLVLFLADQYPEMWGRTRHRFLFTGHLHHHKSADIGGVTWEQLRAVTARDAYAVSHGYTARSQLQAITYHHEHGEISRVKISAH